MMDSENSPIVFALGKTATTGCQRVTECSACHERGNHLAESEASLDEAERAHWERLERELHGRIEGNVLIYSSQDMTQEELRSLVPSLKDKAA